MNELNCGDDMALIDRLVDGELDHDQRRRLLGALDAQPDGWRRCALAFVEAQTWRTELRRIHEPTSAPGVKQEPSTTTVEARPSSRRVSGGAWLAMAAGLLVAFGAGRQLGVIERMSLENAQLADAMAPPAAQPNQLSEADGPTPGDLIPRDAVTLVVHDRRGVPHRVSVPLVEARQLGKQFSDVPSWSSPELVRRLDAQGIGLAARRRYAPLFFEQEDQRIPFVVPVDDAIVTPVSRPVF